jgi:hypothetical protein
MTLAQTRWTSHANYVGKQSSPGWLKTERFLDDLGGYKSFMKSVQQGRRPAPEGIEQVMFGNRRSSQAFIVKQEEQGRPISAEEAIAQVLEITGKDKSLLHQTIRGKQGNPVRAVASWWLIHGAGLTNVQTGEILKMTPVAVSKALARIQSQIDRDRACETAQWLRELRSRFKGQ